MRVLVDLKIEKGHLTGSMITSILQKELSKKKYNLGDVKVWSSAEIRPGGPVHHAIELVRVLQQNMEDHVDSNKCSCSECQENRYY
jgi:hypothetical protein